MTFSEKITRFLQKLRENSFFHENGENISKSHRNFDFSVRFSCLPLQIPVISSKRVQFVVFEWVIMVGRELLQSFKCLSVKDLLLFVSLVCKQWKFTVYSDEILLSFLSKTEEKRKNAFLPLYERLKKAYKVRISLLHLEKGRMRVWKIDGSLRTDIHMVISNSRFVRSSAWAVVGRGTALVTGGEGQKRLCLTVKWKAREMLELDVLLKPHSDHAIVVVEESVYVSGGDGGNYSVKYAEKYENKAWVAIEDMLTPRKNHTLCVYRDRIYAFGGADYTNAFSYRRSMSVIEFYDGKTWTGTDINLPGAEKHLSIISFPTGFLLLGGENRYSSIPNSLMFWDKTIASWRKSEHQLASYTLCNSVALKKGVVYFFDQSTARQSIPLSGLVFN